MRAFLGFILTALLSVGQASAADVGKVAYCDELHPPSSGEGAAAQFSAYTFAVESDSVVFYGYSFPDASLIRINMVTKTMSTLAVPENLIAHDMVAFEGLLYILQDRGSLEHADRFLLYERLSSGEFRTHRVRHGLATMHLGGKELPVVGGARLGIDPEGTVFVMDMHDGRFINVIVNDAPVPLENQDVQIPVEDTGTDRTLGNVRMRTRLEATATYLDCWVSQTREGSFKIPASNATYATEGRAFQPVLWHGSIEIWSATVDTNGITFHRYPIGG